MQVGVPPPERRYATTFTFEPPKSIEGLDGIEGHFNWFMSRKYDLHALEIKTEKKLKAISDWFDHLGELDALPLSRVGKHFFKSFLEQVVGEPSDAWMTLDTTAIVIQSLQDILSEEAFQILNYLLICEKATFSYQAKNMEAAEYYLSEMRQLFTPELYSEKARATILYLLGHFVASEKEARIHFCREAVELDPGNWQLQLALYRALRSYRRKSNWGCGPYVEEVTTCLKGVQLINELNPTSDGLRALANINLTHLLEEVFIAAGRGAEYNHLIPGLLPVDERLLSSSRDAAELTPTCLSTQVKYGDVLSRFIRGSASKLAECEEQYKYCLATWPKDSQVFHKAGKFYAQHTQRTDYGIQLLCIGIELEEDNFPCWMDYLRHKVKHLLLRENENIEEFEEWELLLAKLKEGIAHFDLTHKPVYKRKLLQARGAILWKRGYTCEALNSWIDAFEIEFNPENWKKDMASSSIFSVYVNFGKVLGELEKMKAAEGIPTTRADVMNQLTELLKAGRKERNRNWNNDSNENVGGRGNRGQGYTTCAADKDGDWRRPRPRASSNDVENLSDAFVSWRLGEGAAAARGDTAQNSDHAPYPLSGSWNDNGNGQSSAAHGKRRGNDNDSTTDKGRIRKTSESDFDDNWRK